ncbi:MAG: hypothetical protein IIU00_07895 [Clostridia bacterium]|nr:hypothetical protein [Clostridia bacterium]
MKMKLPEKIEQIENISKRTMAIALAAALILSASVGAGVNALLSHHTKASVQSSCEVKAENQATPEKDETVYVIADASGNPQKVVVSDWLKNEQNQAGIATVSDEDADGGYSIDSDNAYSWDTQSGELDQASDLPVSVKLSYLLDGKEMTAEQIAGKSGKATIRFDYTNNRKQVVSIDGKDADIYVPFTVITGAVLDDSVFSNIEVSNGKIINDGTRSIVIGFALPGMQDSLALKKDAINIPDSIEITADVKNFSLTTTLTMVTNDVFNQAAEDVDQKKAEQGDSDFSLNQLTGGINQLADGSSALYDGTSQLLDKSGMLISGIQQLAEGSQQVSGGVITVRQTLQLLCSKNADLQGGAATVFDTLLSTTRKQVEAAGMSCPELTRDNYADVLGGISSGLSEETLRAMAEQALADLPDQVESAVRQNVSQQVEDAIRQNVTAQVDEKCGEIEQQVTAGVQQQVHEQVLQGVLVQEGLTAEQYEGLDAEQKAAIDSKVGAMTGQQMQSDQIQQTIQDTVESKKQQLIEENMQSEAVKSQKQQLINQSMQSDEVQAQISGIINQKMSEINATLNAKLPAARDGKKSIDAAIEQLNTYNEFYQGILQYTNGVRSLYNGTEQLESGAQQLSEGLDKLNGSTGALAQGVNSLNDGAMRLSDGMKLFRDGSLGKLASLAGGSTGDLSARFKALRDVSEAYKSYTGLHEGESGKVKFIYRTDSIEASDAK